MYGIFYFAFSPLVVVGHVQHCADIFLFCVILLICHERERNELSGGYSH